MAARLRLAWLMAAAVAAVIIADFALDQRERVFWFDEVLTGLLVQAPTGDDFRRSLASGAHHTPPAYFLALRAWCAVAGDSAQALRLPSLAATLAGSCLLVLVLRRAFGLWPAVLGACASLATSSVLLANLNEARPGAAWWLLQVAWLWVVTAPEAGAAGWFRGRVATALLLGFAVPAVHYAGFAFTAAGAAALCGVAVVWRAPGHARLGVATALGLALFAITHADLALVQQSRNIYGDWIAEPQWAGFAALYRRGMGPAWEVVALAALGAVAAWRTRSGRRRPATASGAVRGAVLGVGIAWFAVPVVLWGVEAAGGPNLVYARYTVPLDVCGAILAAAAAAWALRALAGTGWARRAAVGCAAVLAARVLVDPTVHSWAFTAYAVDELAETGAVVYATDVYMMYPLAWSVRDPGRVVLLARTEELAGRFRDVTPLATAASWVRPLADRRPGLLVLTPIRAREFRPEAWVELNRLRVVARGATGDGTEVWRVEPLP